MLRANPIWTNVTAGELSPRMAGLVDQSKYYNGWALLLNFLILTQGPVSKCPGLQFIAAAKHHDKKCRLLDFEFSTIQAYILEFGDEYIRFFKDKGQIMDGLNPYEKVSPYSEADLPGLKYVQSADTMYLVHPDYHPRQLTRTGHTAWTLAEMVFVDGPYLAENTGAITITPSATTGNIILTASAPLFDAGHVGAFWRLKYGATWGYVKITAFTDSTHVNATVIVTLGGVTATAAWREGAWSGYRGYPRALCFHEERLFFAGTAHQPQTIWGSKSADFTNFAPEGTITDEGPITYTIPGATGQVNAIHWLASGSHLLAGTVNEEIPLSGSGTDDPLTASNPPRIRGNTNKGSADMMPLNLGNVLLFVQRHLRKLRELYFSFADNTYVAPDLTIMSEHITKPGLVYLNYQKEPDQRVWGVRSDGVAVVMVYEREQQVVGWSRRATDGLFESINTIPGTKQTEIWAAVQRTIGGVPKRYIECFKDEEWEERPATETHFTVSQRKLVNAFFVDSGLTYDPDPPVKSDTITGLDHLEGKTVKVLADGAVHPDCVVSGGAIQLDYEAYVVHAGLGYTAVGKTMRPEAGARDGTSQGKTKRISKVVLRLIQALGGKVGPDLEHLEPLIYREVADDIGAPPPLCGVEEAEDKLVGYQGSYETKAQVMIVHEDPLPFTVAAVMPRMSVSDN